MRDCFYGFSFRRQFFPPPTHCLSPREKKPLNSFKGFPQKTTPFFVIAPEWHGRTECVLAYVCGMEEGKGMRKCNEALFPLLLIPAHYVLQRERKIGIMHIITLWERGVGGWGRGGGQSINFLAKPFSSTSIPTETKRRSPSPDPLASLDALFYIRLRSPQQKPSLQQGLLPIK